MSAHPDHRIFDDPALIPTTPSNVVPLRPDQQPAPDKKSKGKCYLAPTAKLDFLLAKDIDPDLSPMARRVLTLIMAHRNKDTGEAFPGENEMARILGTTRRQSITDAINELVETDWITKVRKRNPSRKGNDYGSNYYTVLMDKVASILAAAEISFTNGRRKTDDAGTVSRDDAEDQGAVSREGNVRFSVSEDTAKPYHNQPTEPTKVNSPKEPKGSSAAAQQARAPATSPSLGRIELPEDFQPDPVAVRTTLDKGCTLEQIERSLAEWRKRNVGRRFTLAEWTRKASKWLEIEKPGAKPAPDTMGTLLPPEWFPEEPPPYWRERYGLSQNELEHELSAFRDHYRSVSGVAALKRDWNLAFHSWVSKEAKAKAKRQRTEAEKRRIANRY